MDKLGWTLVEQLIVSRCGVVGELLDSWPFGDGIYTVSFGKVLEALVQKRLDHAIVHKTLTVNTAPAVDTA